MGNRKTITDFMLKLFIQEGSNRFHFIGQNGLKWLLSLLCWKNLSEFLSWAPNGKNNDEIKYLQLKSSSVYASHLPS